MMRVHICAIGRLRSGPEHELMETYLDRFDATGRAIGLGPSKIIQLEDKKNGGMKAEAILLENAIPNGALVCTLDERGRQLTSPEFARQLAEWRDQGRGDIAFLIGGADGISPDLRAKADASVSFGKMVWPHMMARAMLCEQLYRATSIIAGKPYHRA